MKRSAVGFLAVVAALVALAAPALATSEAQHLVIIATGPLGAPARIVLSGPVSGVGTTVDTETAGTITVNGGTISVDHPVVTNNDSFNVARCTFRIDETGTYVFTGGTGRYTGISGSGTYTTKGSVVFKRMAHGCTDQVLASLVITKGTGFTILPGVS
jgi:hypothetical protein